MSTLDVVAEVLREAAPRALKAREIAQLAGVRLPTTSRTPETVVSRDLALDVRDRGSASRFLRVGRGEFVLKEALQTAFYNEIDPFAAAWTRNLIAAEEIAAGVVDERSIRDLKPADVASYRQCHFFTGISVWPRAIRDAGWPDDINIWSGSAPCQGMSSAGKRQGFSDERHLWPEWYRLISACRPSVLVTEQVASKDGRAWLDLVFTQLANIDYACQAFDLPACGLGAPHRRQRLFIVAYARERGREILGASWLHDRKQPGHDTARRSEAHNRNPVSVSDATSTRPHFSEDAGADRSDAYEGFEAIERRPARDLEPERGGDVDAASAVPDTERVVWDEGRQRGPHGRPEVEPDRYSEADGTGGLTTSSMVDAYCSGPQGGVPRARGWDGTVGTSEVGCSCLGTVGLGDAGLARSGWNAGEISGAQEAGEGEWIEAGDLADELVAPSADDRSAVGDSGDGADRANGGGATLVRGAASDSRDVSTHAFRPGDRIRLDGDPSWGGAVRGYWAEDVEWIYCRPEPGHQDGRWRPAKSGTQPLADGFAADLGRTRASRLRCYGNAIVLPLAVAFVEAVIDTFVDAREVAEKVL